MTSPKRAFLAVVAGLALTSCQTITEEMPGAPTSPTNGGGGATTPIPVVVVPVPVPVPSSAPAPEPTNAPGPSNPNPNPNPTPKPTTPPPNNPGTGATVRIGAKVFFVERNGQILPGSEHATEAFVGDRVHLDATAKDAANLPVNTHGAPRWTYSDASLANVSGQGDWTPVMLVKKPGVMSVYVEADGIRSNTVTISFR